MLQLLSLEGDGTSVLGESQLVVSYVLLFP